MINPNIPRNIQFRIETMYAKNKNHVGRIKPDENGIYKGLPMMTLGQETQQRTYYEPASVMDQIVNPESRFNKILTQGKAYGEYGHPQFFGMSDSEKIQRLTTVIEANHSHVFTSFYTDKPSADGTVVLRADLKPTGPNGAVFKEGLDDPVINTAFSLRAFVDTQVKPNGQRYRTVRSLTTFDTVGPSGYANTDKAHALGLESFAGESFLDYDIQVMDNGNLLIEQVALETFSNTDLNEIFGVSNISKVIQSYTLVKPDRSLAERFPTLYRDGIFNEFFKEV